VRLILALLCLLASMVATGCGGGSDEPDVRAHALVLNRPDLPAGFLVNSSQTGPVSNEQVASGRPDNYVARLEEWGRVEGYSRQFTRRASVRGPLAGADTIDSVASLYEDQEGAGESFASGVREYPRVGFAPAGRIDVGDGTGRAFRGTNELAGEIVEYVILTWRRGRVIANVVTSGSPGRVELDALRTLARKQDDRIARALD
jgi:hypothetical protein